MSSPSRRAGPPADKGAGLLDYLAAFAQYPLPTHAISRLVHALTRSRVRWLKDMLIRRFIAHFGVDMNEAQHSEPSAYPDFNSFFTRALKSGCRPLASGRGELICPVDGTVSQVGHIESDSLLQAKGHYYSLQTLLGGSRELADTFANGEFATLYLSPRDYHRIHMPLEGRLRQMVHVPGRLFSVNPRTTRAVPRLFARNERVVTVFDTAAGPIALVLVGAINVASIETIWHGEVTPPAGRSVRTWRYEDAAAPLVLERGQEMGRFNMGSTVIVLFAPGAAAWDRAIHPGAPVRMGQRLGRQRD
ncbi:MAG TPA: archaetidylserine decarboxylase [Gammaproteobacteria bacterium]|nr:archaetidylserine decarboxylase [Gammaproteobacteria bacterium]